MTLMQRRRALMMGAKKSEEPLALVDGTYYDGEVVITNGNHLSVNVTGRQWRQLTIPFNREISATNGDIFTIIPTGTPIRGNMGFTRLNGTYLQASDDYWPSGSGQNVTETNETTYIGFFVRNRNVGKMIGNFTVSIEKNGEVIM